MGVRNKQSNSGFCYELFEIRLLVLSRIYSRRQPISSCTCSSVMSSNQTNKKSGRIIEIWTLPHAHL
jgi:hypothetical protein